MRLSSWFRSGLRLFSLQAFQRASLVACLLVGGIPIHAQGVAARVVAPVNESSLVTLKGNVHPLARPEFDQGAVPASTPLTHVQLVLKRSAQQEAALEAYLASAQQPNSPNYHKWVTPEQFGSLYGPADADIQKMTTWLQGHGFTVNNVSKGKTSIDFSGTAAQVGDAFHVEIHSFNANGKQFNANTTAPQIPAAFAPVVSGVANLNTDRPKPLNIPGRGGHYDPSLRRFVPESSVNPGAGSGPRPNFTSPPTGGSTIPDLYVTPADAATIYDTPNKTLNAKFYGGPPYDGTGVTIGIVGQSNIDPSIVSNYRQLFLGDTTDITKVLTISDPNNVGKVTSEAGEVYLDTEVSGGLAPGASIHLYVASGVGGAARQAIEENSVDVLSVSYGECELTQGQDENKLFNDLWEQAAAEGITVFVATGDEGSAACDAHKQVAVNGLNVNGIASTPYNIAVGGTDYYPLVNNFNTYVNSDNTPDKHYGTALGYIPESTWNNTTSPNEMLSQNVSTNRSTLAAGSGGPSNCAMLDANGQCVSGYRKPTWQTGAGVPNDGVRDLPDVSLFSGSGYLSASWLVCDESEVTSTQTLQNCSTPSWGNPSFSFAGSGGTSASTPALAGIFALIVQKNGQRQGQAAPALYSLAKGSDGSKIFHDVTIGNIAMPCTQGTKDCTLNAAGNYFLSGYDTNAGYDLATGLGSVDVTQLVANWPVPGSTPPLPPGTTTPTVTVTVSPATITSATAAILTATVAGPNGSPVPTGSVEILIDGTNVDQTVPLTNGSASYTVPANTLKVGPASVTAGYTPDSTSTYFAASGKGSFNVLLGTFTVSGSPVTLSGAPTSGTSTITVTASEGFAAAGKVDLTCTLTGMPANANSAYLPTCTLAQPSVQVSNSTPGTVTATFATTTTATSALSPYRSTPFGSPWSNAGGIILAGALLLVLPRRRAGRTMLALFVAVMILAGTGCGSSSNRTPTAPGTTPGMYTFTILGGLDDASESAPAIAGVAVTVR